MKEIPKADWTWISGMREESKGADEWRPVSPETGTLQEGQVWDMCLRYTEMTLRASGRKSLLREREVRRERRGLDTCDSQFGLSMTKCPSPSS